MADKPKKRSSPIHIPLTFDKAVEGLLRAKPKKKAAKSVKAERKKKLGDK